MGDRIWVSVQGPGLYLNIIVRDELDRLIVEKAMALCSKREQSTDTEGRKDE